eukprot:442089_1
MNIIGILPLKNYSGITNKIADYLSRDIEWHNNPQITPEHGTTEIIPDERGRLFTDEQSKLFYQITQPGYYRYSNHPTHTKVSPLSTQSEYIYMANNLNIIQPTFINRMLYTYYSSDDHILGGNSPNNNLTYDQTLNNKLNNKSYIPSYYYQTPYTNNKPNNTKAHLNY